MQRIKTLPITKLTPAEANPRQHSEAQIAQIAASIEEFGWTTPILVDGELNVIAGHGRLLAAQSLGLKAVPTIALDHLTPEQARAYRIADNKLNEGSEWNEDLLRQELEALASAGFNTEITGWDLDDLAQEPFNPSDEWTGMPAYESVDRRSFRQVTVHFQDQAGVDEFVKRIGMDLPEKARFLFFPERPPDDKTAQMSWQEPGQPPADTEQEPSGEQT